MVRSSSAGSRSALTLAVAVLAMGCTAAHPISQSASDGEALGQQRSPAERKVIRTGELTVTVDDPGEAAREVERIVSEAGGFVERSTSARDANSWVYCRVPSDRLHAIMDVIAGLGDEESRSVSATDVTEKYFDLEARLRSKIELRDRLRRLLDRAEDVDDALTVERELNRVQSDIETMQAQLDRLKSQVELSGLSVSLRRQRILGPLGLLGWGLSWGIEKLFVIR